MALVVADPSSVPSPTPTPPPGSPSSHPHRRLYTHPRPSSSTPTTPTRTGRSVFSQHPPLMLLPRARLYDDNDDLLRRRPHSVVPDTGLERLHLSAISASSGWIGVGVGEGRGGGGGSRRRRPLTAFDFDGRRRRKERKAAGTVTSAGHAAEDEESEDSRSPHPLKTRSGKMALLRERSQHHTTLSVRSASADSGLGSSPTLDKTAHDVSTSDFPDDVTRISSTENLSQHTSLLSNSNSSSGGFFGGYMSRHSLTLLHDKLYESGARTSRGALTIPSDEDSALTSDDAFPEHLESFTDAAVALVDNLRRNKKRGEKEEEDNDDVFDEKWHSGHTEGDDCPYCREFARATRGRVDRYFGGTESFLSWIFSKWGKRKELEGSYRRSLGTRGKSPHFCNFVHKVDLHTRYDNGHARTGSGSDDDERDSLLTGATDHDILAQWRKSRLSNSGTEGRPGSPTSLDGRPRDGDVTSLNNGGGSEDEDLLNVSVIVNHLVNSDGESIRRPESMLTDDDNDRDRKGRSKRKNSGKSRAVKTVISRHHDPRARLIPTITIPSSPIPTADQLLSNRSSGESSPRKSAREEPRRPDTSAEKSPKPQPLAVSRPTPPPKEEKKADKGKRLPVTKKTRKGADRRRKSKSVSMEPLPAETSASGEPAAAAGEAESQPTPNGVEVKGKVPDLPEVSGSGKKNAKHGKKAQRRLIATPPPSGEKLHLPQELLDLDSSSRTGYDFSDLDRTLADSYNNRYNPQSWLNTRMALSQQASRFELPMDMKVLEKITPQDYLRKFCVVTARRLNLYQRIFVKHKDKANNINKQGLEEGLKETLVQQLKDTTFTDLCDLLDIKDDTVIDFKLFAGAAAITERILYPCYTTEDTLEKPEYQRERIETADFSALDWKLRGIQIAPKMKKLLKTIE